MGSNWLVVGLIIGLKTWYDPSTVNYALCGFLIGFSCLLLLLGWLQAMEMVLFYYDFSKQTLNCRTRRSLSFRQKESRKDLASPQEGYSQ
jgi:hypothetical protein